MRIYSTRNVNLYMINDRIGYTHDRIGYMINAKPDIYIKFRIIS